LAKKKNLTREDKEDVSIFEDFSQQRKSLTYESNKIRINDIKIDLKCENKKQKDLRQAIEEKDVVISTGPAGTGKTYMSLLTALHLMKTEPKYQKLVLVKSLQTIEGESLGYLPGTLWEKMEPYMFSFTGNLDKIFHSSSITKSLINQEVIQIFPIAYIRGVTIDNAVVIIDEIQNLKIHTFRSIITRIGKNCKMVFLGDADQCDLRNSDESCIRKVIKALSKNDYTGVVEFDGDSDTVRNPMIKHILEDLKGI
jgi:phosphate starvation-inducible protein PhoH and related proteins